DPELMCVPATSWCPQNRGGCVGAWVRGCVGAWVRGCVGGACPTGRQRRARRGRGWRTSWDGERKARPGQSPETRRAGKRSPSTGDESCGPTCACGRVRTKSRPSREPSEERHSVKVAQ